MSPATSLERIFTFLLLKVCINRRTPKAQDRIQKDSTGGNNGAERQGRHPYNTTCVVLPRTAHAETCFLRNELLYVPCIELGSICIA
jgi:hypothetical protein